MEAIALRPDFWSRYPLYIRNEHIHAAEEVKGLGAYPLSSAPRDAISEAGRIGALADIPLPGEEYKNQDPTGDFPDEWQRRKDESRSREMRSVSAQVT